jgi:ribonucleoside-diphosphate reductase beta chain
MLLGNTVTNPIGGRMSIREYREAYKVNGEFEHPEFFEAYQKALSSIWRPQEVSFESDIRDWQNSSQDEREIIGGILRGFTQLECHVSDYWANIPTWFPKHEVAAVSRAFSLSEIVHAEAYNLLSDTLGLDEFEAFLGDPIAQQKIGYFLQNRGIKESLAVFSGAGEGVSLFSSFAVLLSLNLTGRFKGIAQIISWSALDEQQHSDTGIALFRELVSEDPLTLEEAQSIGQGFDAVIENEFAFLDKIFEGRALSTISKDDVREYILYRANDRLARLGVQKVYKYSEESANRIKEWFHPIMKGATSTDFFAQKGDGANYISKPTQDFMGVNLRTLDLALV